MIDRSRREFLEFMGRSALATSAFSMFPALQGCSTLGISGNSKDPKAFVTTYSDHDELNLGKGLRYQVIAKWGDPLNADGLRFGFNNDFLAFFPLNGKSDEGLLCVNHESPDPLFISGYPREANRAKSKSETEMEMTATGVSIVHIKEVSQGSWQIVTRSPYNRSVSGLTEIPIVSERAIINSKVALGTLGNCAGGVTPWGTYLSAEENYDNFYGEASYRQGTRTVIRKPALNWHTHFPQPPEHYGWIVEINPQTGEAKKHTSMGRFAHECATTRLAKDGRTVVYSGDDAEGEHLYKFISDRPGSLEKGTLHVANTRKGEWIPLDRKIREDLRKAFSDHTDLMIRTREAGKMVGATALDRPEDVEICPKTGAVYVTLTNNKTAFNYFGSILKIEEKNNDPLSLEFKASTFATGGTESGFACPDNMAFDRKGGLWMTTDISGSSMNRAPYLPFKNNGLFYIPMEGSQAGKAFLMATAPSDAELTGPTFSPDGRTLFLSVQHPGEESPNLDKLTSHWPDGGASIPKPAVVAISGPTLDQLVR